MSFLSWLYGDAENAQRAAEADAELRRLNSIRYGVDYVNQDEWVPPAQQEEQIAEAFDQGWADGRKNVTSWVAKPFKVVSDGLTAVLAGIPVWVWLLAGVGVWVWLGMPGLNRLKKAIK